MDERESGLMKELMGKAWEQIVEDKPYMDERDKQAFEAGFTFAYTGQHVVYNRIIKGMLDLSHPETQEGV